MKRLKLALAVSLASMSASIFLFVNQYSFVRAAGNGTDIIYACKALSTLAVRIVANSTSCVAMLETPMQWRVGPETGTEFPYVCGNCWLVGVDRFAGRDLSNAWLEGSYMDNSYLVGTNFTDADMTGTFLTGTNLASANFTNADLTGAHFDGAMGATTTNFTNAHWGGTSCPDQTNSDDNGGTCIGHLTP